MAERYLVTGVQLGLLKGLVKTGNQEEAFLLIEGILNTQHCGYSENDVCDDANEIADSKILGT